MSTLLTAGQRGPQGSPSSFFLTLKVLQLFRNSLESLKSPKENSCPKAATKRCPRKAPLPRPRVGSPRQTARYSTYSAEVSPPNLKTPHLVGRAYNSHFTDEGAGSGGGNEVTWPRSPRVRDEEEPPRTRLPPASRAPDRLGARVKAAQVLPRPNAPVRPQRPRPGLWPPVAACPGSPEAFAEVPARPAPRPPSPTPGPAIPPAPALPSPAIAGPRARPGPDPCARARYRLHARLSAKHGRGFSPEKGGERENPERETLRPKGGKRKGRRPASLAGRVSTESRGDDTTALRLRSLRRRCHKR